ncbi:ABC transporter permease [Limnobacter sp.]|uniref:ABC transporter permease n=1 Tax=Limnobacter sp. TaxID=2003368 RepID=UPI003512AD1E
MTPTLLLTDMLIWALVLAVLVYVKNVLGSPLQRASWALVFQSKIASASAVVLLLAVGITLLDSVHLRLNAENQSKYNTPIISVLDVVLGPLAYQREKSYSAPLATRALSKETMELNGKPMRDYPRLQYGGAHLADEANKNSDLAMRAYQGALGGGVLWGVLLLGLWAVRRYMVGEAQANSVGVFSGSGAYLAAVWTLFALCVAGGVLAKWAQVYHVLGTDKVGVDVLYIALKGLRTAMLIGLLTTLLTLPLGVGMGLAAGYFRGWVDDIIQYIYTTLNAIPSVLLIAATVLMLQVALEANPELFESSIEKADLRLFFLCAILGLTSWTGLARLLRGEVLKMREQDYVLAARASGVSHFRILFSHLLPNLMHLILIAMVMDFSGLVLAEAVLSYVGVGVDPSTFSYGTMINAARLELSREPMVWWSLVAAFVFMLLLVLSANLFADAVRDAFDPRARQLKQSLVRV